MPLVRRLVVHDDTGIRFFGHVILGAGQVLISSWTVVLGNVAVEYISLDIETPETPR